MKALAFLSLTWPARLARLMSDDAMTDIVLSMLGDFHDDDLMAAARDMVMNRSTLFDSDNVIAILRSYAMPHAESRANARAVVETKRRSAHDRVRTIDGLLSPLTEQQMELASSPDRPVELHEGGPGCFDGGAALARRIARGSAIRKANLTDIQRADLRAERERIVTNFGEPPAEDNEASS